MSTFSSSVAAAAEGTPYKVTPTKRGFDVELDIVNAHWWELFDRAGLQSSFRWRVREHASYYTITDRQVRMKWSAGVPRFAFSWEMQGGRIFAFTREKIWALSDRGRIEPVVDYRFNSREGRDLIRMVARRQGLKERQPWSVNLALGLMLITPAFFAVYGLVQLITHAVG
ncbi:hypothetical protein BTO20_20045 [Mycobacterium dioxanotrophicus]|uniref:Uncharacterized protein n=1 Tax=Mycobacterium dioxanotrophicus TaxID=482462 RepID=A0A1Y0C644_9MYCO|nr:hypothetical protein [Mycobacterium dioxanotrophicus]ART70525.1 hypothetical protein BTO20_20045 [Mycobacterium dioxanotrophicus]